MTHLLGSAQYCRWGWLTWALTAVAALLWLGSACAADVSADPDEVRVIVKFRHDSTLAKRAAPLRLKALNQRLPISVTTGIEPGPRLQVLRAKRGTHKQLIDHLLKEPDVEWAVPDRIKQPHFLPNDVALETRDQWYLRSSGYVYKGQSPALAAIDAQTAWDIAGGGVGVVVATLDTGVRKDHEDISANLLDGYDLVSFTSISADSDARDPDASDPGDGRFGGSSSWHGTRTAGVIAAVANNATGVAGVAWGAKVLPVRVLGRGGGYDSDIIAGMRWAAGIPVSGIPDNPNPAKVLNLSLGGTSGCSQAYQEAIADVTTRGALVVVSTGNEGGSVDEPAKCPGVLAVAGVRHVGTKVGYSSFGPETGISAPAGNCVNVGNGQECMFSIDTSTNLGSAAPGANGYTSRVNPNGNVGTSFSSPIAAGVAALMLAVNPQLTPAELIDRIKRSARTFPVDPLLPFCTENMVQPTSDEGQCNCTPTSCGAGLLDAATAVGLAQQSSSQPLPPVTMINRQSNGLTGGSVILDGRGSFVAPGDTIASMAWSYLSGPRETPPLQQNGALSSFVPPDPGTYTYRLTVTDSRGLSASAMQTFEVDAAPGYVSTTTTTTSTTTTSSTTTTTVMTFDLVTGWNLVGNGYSQPLDPAVLFGNPDQVASVWKWVPASASVSPSWAFYSPGLPGGGNDYARSKGYVPLAVINGGEGFWVNAKIAFSTNVPTQGPLQSSSFTPGIASPSTPGGAHALAGGWNLIATGDRPTPTRFDAAIATVLSTPPAPGQVYSNLTTLWAWDAKHAGWYFWAPRLVNDSGLQAYLTGRNYLDFATVPNTPVGTLAPTTGFWVNMP